jgi:hypothetical protein
MIQLAVRKVKPEQWTCPATGWESSMDLVAMRRWQRLMMNGAPTRGSCSLGAPYFG